VRDLDALYNQEWDLTLRQVIPYINGHNYASRIAALSDVDLKVVQACLRHLLYHGHIELVDIFQYSNTYMVTPRITELATNLALQHQCEQYVALPEKQPPFTEIFKLYCAMKPNIRLNVFCDQRNTRELGVDDRRLVVFGVVHGFLRRIHHYPVYTSSSKRGLEPADRRYIELWESTMNGAKSFDEICCEFARSSVEINQVMNHLKALHQSCVVIAK